MDQAQRDLQALREQDPEAYRQWEQAMQEAHLEQDHEEPERAEPDVEPTDESDGQGLRYLASPDAPAA